MDKCTCGIEIINHPASRCLDLLVIEKVLMWKFIYSENFFNKGELDYFVDEKGDSRILGFSPSSDISAAMEVFEKSNLLAIEKTEQGYSCADSYDEQGYIFIYHSPTLPIAICQAALLKVKG